MSARFKIALVTDHRGSGYGGAVHTGAILRMLAEDGFASVEVIGPADYPPTTLPLAIASSRSARLGKWLRGRTESYIDDWPDDAIRASRRLREFDAVLLDGSLLGGNLARVRRSFPAACVGTIFHNVELDFVDSQSRWRAPHVLAKRPAVRKAERAACVDTDFGIALHAGDSARLKLHYGREADHLLPITLDPPVLQPAPELAAGPATALFVGSLFRPNVEAIAFLHAEVAPLSPLPIVVAGRRTEELRARFPDNERFRIVGSVPDLRPLYTQAAVVLSPVSIGGGMKVKNIEALAHGKRVICTPHAAAGLDEEVRRGWVVLAEDAQSFAAAMGRLSGRPRVAVETEIADWFSSHYSTTARGPSLRAFLQTRMERHTGPGPTSNE